VSPVVITLSAGAELVRQGVIVAVNATEAGAGVLDLVSTMLTCHPRLVIEGISLEANPARADVVAEVMRLVGVQGGEKGPLAGGFKVVVGPDQAGAVQAVVKAGVAPEDVIVHLTVEPPAVEELMEWEEEGGEGEEGEGGPEYDPLASGDVIVTDPHAPDGFEEEEAAWGDDDEEEDEKEEDHGVREEEEEEEEEEEWDDEAELLRMRAEDLDPEEERLLDAMRALAGRPESADRAKAAQPKRSK
jgi:hypothetical protein